MPDDLAPSDALERAILPAFEGGPCFVSFSGGRDSSTVLAAATRVARRRGLDPPVPVTLRFPDAPMADEADWQELVVDHLGLADWLRVELHDELDYVGPVAQRVMRRHGVLFPFNSHYYVPILERMPAGATLLTGGGGDALLHTWRWQAEAQVLSGRTRPSLRRLPRLAYFAAPAALRRPVVRARVKRRAWLTPRGQALLRRAVAGDAGEPRRFDSRLAWLLGRRYLHVARRSADLLAADAGVRIEHPLLNAPVVAAVAREGGRLGPGDRTAAMRRFFAPLLPDAILARRSKAAFGETFYTARTREFLESWDGRVPFPELVDPSGLRDAWAAGDAFTPRLLLQATWLASVRVRPQ